MSEASKTVLAIDPGSRKCGFALAHRTVSGEILLDWRCIAAPEELMEKLREAGEIRSFNMVVIGSGTKSRGIVETIREQAPSMGILLVDERNTTLQARERYWEHSPRRGWRRLLPATLQTPPEPVDDFVAFILAERVLQV